MSKAKNFKYYRISINLATWPSLTSAQFSAAELFFKMCKRANANRRV